MEQQQQQQQPSSTAVLSRPDIVQETMAPTGYPLNTIATTLQPLLLPDGHAHPRSETHDQFPQESVAVHLHSASVIQPNQAGPEGTENTVVCGTDDNKNATNHHAGGNPRTMGQNQVILRHQKFTFPRARE